MKYILPMFATITVVSIIGVSTFTNYTDNKKLEARIDLQNKTIQTISKENEQMEKTMSENDAKINTGHAKVDALRKLVEEHQSDLKEYKEENSLLKKKIDELEKELNQKRKTSYDDSKKVRVSIEKDATPKKEAKSIVKDDNNSKGYPIEVTAYTAFCQEGCTGKTATGVDVSSTVWYNGYRIIATDRNFMAMGQKGIIKFADGSSMKVIAMDTGGAIVSNKIDLLVSSHDEAIRFGRQSATLIKKGE